MLQAIHDNLKGVFAIVILGALAVVFIFWGAEFVSVGGFSSTSGVEVNGQDLNVNQIRERYQEQLAQYQAATHADDVPKAIRDSVRKAVLDQAVRVALIQQRTRALRFQASDQAVLDSIHQIPAFQVDGKFSKDAYYATLRANNLEPANFEAQQRQDLAAQQLERGITATAFVLPGEFERREAILGEKREGGWFVVPASHFTASENPDEAAIAAWYDAHKAQFQTEARANLQYVDLDLADLAKSLTVTDQELRSYYEDNKDRYTTPERRRAQHILFTGDDAKAKAAAEAAYKRAVAGEDFGKLAEELSQDPGSAKQGGDLGWREEGFFVKPFADAVWSMKPGEIKGPIKTQFGWHVIKLDGVEPGKVETFEQVKPQLEVEYRRNHSEKLFNDLQDKLDTAAFEANGDMKHVADAMALPVKTLDGFTQKGAAELSESPGFVKMVFDPDVLNGSQIKTAQLSPSRVIAFKVVAYNAPHDRPLAEVHDAVKAAYVEELARKAAVAKADALVAELRKGADWDKVARPWADAAPKGPDTVSLHYVERGDPNAPAPIVDALFTAGRPAGDKPIYGTTVLPSGDATVWTLTFVKPGSVQAMSADDRKNALQAAQRASAMADSAVYVDELQSKAKVKVNEQLFE